MEIKKHAKIENVETKQAPDVPINRPKNKQEKTLKKGKTRIQRYIKQ